jgi:hypothetical protein
VFLRFHAELIHCDGRSRADAAAVSAPEHAEAGAAATHDNGETTRAACTCTEHPGTWHPGTRHPGTFGAQFTSVTGQCAD